MDADLHGSARPLVLALLTWTAPITIIASKPLLTLLIFLTWRALEALRTNRNSQPDSHLWQPGRFSGPGPVFPLLRIIVIPAAGKLALPVSAKLRPPQLTLAASPAWQHPPEQEPAFQFAAAFHRHLPALRCVPGQ
jgi:hypothetical protein